jgi:hypothetical protein
MAGDAGFKEVAIVAPDGAEVPRQIDGLDLVTQRYGSRLVIAEWRDDRARAIETLARGMVLLHEDDDSGPPPGVELDDAAALGLAAFQHRASSEYAAALASRPLDGEPWDTDEAQSPDLPGGQMRSTSAAPRPAGVPLSERLTGSVAVGVIIVEGPSRDGLQFTHDERLKVHSKVQDALAWLGRQQQLRPVSWSYDLRDVTLEVAPNSSLPKDQWEALWRDPAMKAMGYGPGIDPGGVEDYVIALRSFVEADWAFCAFFTKYPAPHFAYADVGGPHLVMEYSNDGWGPDNIDRVFAHETCHIFGAPDEYSKSGCDCLGSWGFFGLPNGNCETCAAHGGTACLMRQNTLVMCPYTPWHIGVGAQQEINDIIFGSDPFVAAGVVYFQGPANQLMRVDVDGTNLRPVGGCYTSSAPYVYEGVVYFRGTDDALWAVNIDGSYQRQISDITIASSPFVAGGIVFWQAVDNTLWRVNIDATKQQQIGNEYISSPPFCYEGVVYFQGEKDELRRVVIDGSNQWQIANNYTSSSPFVVGGIVFFRGTDDKLWRINIDGTKQAQIGDNYTLSTPVVMPGGIVFFQATDNNLNRVVLDGTDKFQLAGAKTCSSPFYSDGRLFYLDEARRLCVVLVRAS